MDAKINKEKLDAIQKANAELDKVAGEKIEEIRKEINEAKATSVVEALPEINEIAEKLVAITTEKLGSVLDPAPLTGIEQEIKDLMGGGLFRPTSIRLAIALAESKGHKLDENSRLFTGDGTVQYDSIEGMLVLVPVENFNSHDYPLNQVCIRTETEERGGCGGTDGDFFRMANGHTSNHLDPNPKALRIPTVPETITFLAELFAIADPEDIKNLFGEIA